MAKKISRGTKRILSLIFHLVVLFVMVNLYDTARAMLKNGEPPPPKAEKKTAAPGDKATGKPTSKPTGVTFEELMAEKKQIAKDKAAAEKK